MTSPREVPSRVDLATATAIAEVRRTGNPFVLNPTKPDAPVYTLADKSQRRGEGGSRRWQPGDRLRATFTVDQPRPHHSAERSASSSLKLSDGLGDVDLYTLEGFSPADQKALRDLGIAQVEAVVEIQKPGVEHEHHLDVYPSKLVSIQSIAQPFDGDVSRLREYSREDCFNPGTERALIEGKVVGYVPTEDYPYEGSYISVGVQDQVVMVKLPSGKTTVYSGDMGIINPSHPLPGDRIQFNMVFGGVVPDSGEMIDVSGEAGSLHLLEASQERREAYDAQRRKVAETSVSISQEDDPGEIRKIISDLMKVSLYKADGDRDSLAIMKDEKTALRRVIDQQIPDERVRPLDLFDSVYEAEGVRKGFGVDIYSMSKVGYYAFCMQVAKLEVPQRETNGASYMYSIMKRNLSEPLQMDILLTSVHKLSPIVIGSIAQLGKNEDQDSAMARKGYLLREALSSLSEKTSVQSVGAFTSVLDGILDKKEQLLGKQEMHKFVRDFVNSVSGFVDNLTQRDGKKIVDVTNTKVTQRVISLLPKLQQLQEGFQEGVGSVYTRDEIEHAVSRIQAAAAFLYLRDVLSL